MFQTNIFIVLLLPLIDIAQALLDLPAGAGDYKVLEEGELLGYRWSGDGVDTRYVDSTTERRMEALYSQINSTRRCPEAGCQFTSRHWRCLNNHAESHSILDVCDCGYLSSYRDTTTEHGRTKHQGAWTPVVQVDSSMHALITGPPDQMPVLFIRSLSTGFAQAPDVTDCAKLSRSSQERGDWQGNGGLQISKESATTGVEHQIRRR